MVDTASGSSREGLAVPIRCQSISTVFRHLLGAEVTSCIETKLNRSIWNAAFSEALGRCRGCSGRRASSKHKVSPPSTKARRLRSSRHELVAAREATSTSELILFRAFVQALGGLDPCRNGRKRCRKHGLNSYRQTNTNNINFFFWHPGADFFFPGVSRPTIF